MAISPDGHVPTASERRTHYLRKLLTGELLESLRFGAPVKPELFLAVDGAAAQLLNADLAPAQQRQHDLDVVIAGASRFFVDALHTDEFKTSKQTRSDGSGWLRLPSDLAFKAVAVRYAYAEMHAINVARLVLGAEQAKRNLGFVAMHPAFTLIQNKPAAQDEWDELLTAAHKEIRDRFGTILVLPSRDYTGLECGYWTSHERIELVRISPERYFADLRESIMRDQQWRHRDKKTVIPFVKDEQTRQEDQMLDRLVRTRLLSAKELVDSILPLESQAALAYEGLYFCNTETARTKDLSVTFAGRREQVSAQDWAKVFNHLVAKPSPGALVADALLDWICTRHKQLAC